MKNRYRTIVKATTELPIEKEIVIKTILAGNQNSNGIYNTLKPVGLTPQQYNVLRILRGQHDTPASLTEIQNKMINTMSNTTRLIDKLIEKKYVTRQQDPDNKRMIQVQITSLGNELVCALDEPIYQAEVELTENLTNQEKKELARLLEKIIS